MFLADIKGLTDAVMLAVQLAQGKITMGPTYELAQAFTQQELIQLPAGRCYVDRILNSPTDACAIILKPRSLAAIVTRDGSPSLV